MGQYLAIGLAIEIRVEKKRIEEAQINIEQLQEKMKYELYYTPEIYDDSDKGEFYHFSLKNDILYAQLIPFLEEIYPLLYNNSKYYDGIIEKLKRTPPPQWIELAKEKPEVAFQFDEYGMWDYIEINNTGIRIFYDYLLLSLEGKILMEEWGRHFRFFKYTMIKAFKQFAISGALETYISG